MTADSTRTPFGGWAARHGRMVSARGESPIVGAAPASASPCPCSSALETHPDDGSRHVGNLLRRWRPGHPGHGHDPSATCRLRCGAVMKCPDAVRTASRGGFWHRARTVGLPTVPFCPHTTEEFAP